MFATLSKAEEVSILDNASVSKVYTSSAVDSGIDSTYLIDGFFKLGARSREIDVPYVDT